MKECNQCGKCCIHYSNDGLSASDNELDWWENNRPEIFSHTSGNKIWANPTTGKPLARCPWLQKLPDQQKYTCLIYADRPDDCKYYPATISQMAKDECEMLEDRDLANQKQAQKTLDILMADSRTYNS